MGPPSSYAVNPKYQIKFTIASTAVLAFALLTALPRILQQRELWIGSAGGVLEDWKGCYARLGAGPYGAKEPEEPSKRNLVVTDGQASFNTGTVHIARSRPLHLVLLQHYIIPRLSSLDFRRVNVRFILWSVFSLSNLNIA